MTTGWRKIALTAHVSSSAGWTGAVAAFLALVLTGLHTRDVRMAQVVYPAMQIIARYVIVPLTCASLLSGLVQALGTRWGLFRYRWVWVKFVLTVFATAVLLAKLPLIASVARQSSIAASSHSLHFGAMQLAVHAAGGVLVLLSITAISVFKPWGLTEYGNKKMKTFQAST